MILGNYSNTRAGKLEKIAFSDITEPFGMKIMWMQFLSYENGRKKISMKRHEHSYFEAHFIISGNIEYRTDRGIYRPEEGMGFLLAPETPHTITAISENFVKCTLAYSVDESSFMYRALCDKSEFLFDMNENFISCLDAILEESDNKSVFTMPIIKGRIFDMICTMSRMAGVKEENAESDSGSGDVRIERIKRYIEDNKGSFFNCSEIANQFHFNPKYLNRIFKEETGSTLLEYIHRAKISDVEKLLSESDASLESISKQLGFANEYYFNSFFKRCTGITPGQYRKLSGRGM